MADSILIAPLGVLLTHRRIVMSETPANFESFKLEKVGEMIDTKTRTLRAAITRGELPAFRIGKGIRIRATDLEEFVSRRMVEDR